MGHERVLLPCLVQEPEVHRADGQEEKTNVKHSSPATCKYGLGATLVFYILGISTFSGGADLQEKLPFVTCLAQALEKPEPSRGAGDQHTGPAPTCQVSEGCGRSSTPTFRIACGMSFVGLGWKGDSRLRSSYFLSQQGPNPPYSPPLSSSFPLSPFSPPLAGLLSLQHKNPFHFF